MRSTNIDIEALCFGRMIGIAQMPLANQRSQVTCFLKMLSNSVSASGRSCSESAWRSGRSTWPLSEPSDQMVMCNRAGCFPVMIEARVGVHNGCRRIGLREADRLRGQPIQMRCFVKICPVAPQIRPAQIIGQDEHDVWFGLSVQVAQRQHAQNKNEFGCKCFR